MLILCKNLKYIFISIIFYYFVLMNQVKNALKSSDIYGNIIGFKYEGDDRIKSYLGGCLTLCLLIISIIV